MDEKALLDEIDALHRIIDVLVSKLRGAGVIEETKDEIEREANIGRT